jgi:raffinose/stachyose/melibiose transport system permease protein
MLDRIQKNFLSTRARQTSVWILFLLPAVLVYIVFMAGPLFDSLRLSLYTGQGYTPTQFVGCKTTLTFSPTHCGANAFWERSGIPGSSLLST